MNKIQSLNRSIGAYEFNNFYLPCFDEKNYILGDGIDVLALGTLSKRRCKKQHFLHIKNLFVV